jgi:hypothetical protein
MKKQIVIIIILLCSTAYPQLSTDGKFYLLNLGKIKLAITNDGGINYPDQPFPLTAGIYDTIPFLYSGGFYLSGYSTQGLWGNGVTSTSRVLDYQPGPVGSNPGSSENKIYLLHSYDEPFGHAWQQWKKAVELGADFYDGDGDGIYDPVDKNNNNKWDLDEDRPDFLGTETIWCVYNDGVESALRRFTNIQPQGIEIHQTVFVYNVGTPLGRTIFIRYRIINKGTVADILDSVYFSSFTDPDINKLFDTYIDDLVGCDTLSNSGFCFNSKHDTVSNLDLAFITSLLQGPPEFKAGSSYIDINNNGIYDADLDTALDTAFLYNGFKGIDTIPGAQNYNMTSFMAAFRSHWDVFIPVYAYELRYIQMGKDKVGEYLNPCNWIFGTVTGNVPCEQVNPVFMYSGDPYNNIGWLNTFATNQMMYVTKGPFDLHKDKPVDIIVAYSVGKGEEPLEALRDAKTSLDYARIFHKRNFGIEVPEYVEEEAVKYNFVLRYNYPNPFNSETVIEYSLDKRSYITLKVYNLLGEEVATLVDREEDAGFYSTRFNPAASKLNLPSGIYTAVLKADASVDAIKMIYLK